MKNNLKYWYRPKILSESKKLISEIIDSTFINDGLLSKKFSDELNVIVDRKYSTCVPNGTAGLFLALKSLKLKETDEIIIPNFSFIATANSAYLASSNINFVDVNRNDFCIDPEKLEQKIKELRSKGKNVGVVITVEVNGRSPDYKKILDLKKKYNFYLVTDSAQALGSWHNKKPLGSFGDISVISLGPNKVISSGQGGVILTNNKKLFKNIMSYKLNGNSVRGDGGRDKFNEPGFNFKFSDIQAAIVYPQLKDLKKRKDHIIKIRNEYIKKFKDIATFPELTNDNIPLWVDCIPKNKKTFLEILNKNNVGFREFWIPLNQQKSYIKYRSQCENSDFISKNGVWLASNFYIKPEEIKNIKL